MFGGNLAKLIKAGGARRKRAGSRKRTGSRKSGGGDIVSKAMDALQNTAKAGSPTVAAPTAPMKGGRRTRRLRKRSGKAKRRSARAHSAGGRTRQRGGNKHVPLAPANL
jgi:hypothetical protein